MYTGKPVKYFHCFSSSFPVRISRQGYIIGSCEECRVCWWIRKAVTLELLHCRLLVLRIRPILCWVSLCTNNTHTTMHQLAGNNWRQVLEKAPMHWTIRYLVPRNIVTRKITPVESTRLGLQRLTHGWAKPVSRRRKEVSEDIFRDRKKQSRRDIKKPIIPFFPVELFANNRMCCYQLEKSAGLSERFYEA